ncbi:hypothetical protein SKAU_G00125700 [Synaphobranchus kaupii]|uniref:Uncharacterized protein n=1 Tax=Synaphobranchus kaupii TaxID=118154 RepID=A0A9Q1J1W0_SYNKA|nr:hypothetical protein SKAU_G00125700 [Synaphobranchus kaupii]
MQAYEGSSCYGTVVPYKSRQRWQLEGAENQCRMGRGAKGVDEVSEIAALTQGEGQYEGAGKDAPSEYPVPPCVGVLGRVGRGVGQDLRCFLARFPFTWA